jgi:hypothetical protein
MSDLPLLQAALVIYTPSPYPRLPRSSDGPAGNVSNLSILSRISLTLSYPADHRVSRRHPRYCPLRSLHAVASSVSRLSPSFPCCQPRRAQPSWKGEWCLYFATMEIPAPYLSFPRRAQVSSPPMVPSARLHTLSDVSPTPRHPVSSPLPSRSSRTRCALQIFNPTHQPSPESLSA